MRVDQMILRKWSVTDLEEPSGLLAVVARLDQTAPLELAECFGNDYEGPAWPEDLEAPALDGVLITFRVRPEDVVRYRDALHERLAAANRRYAGVIVPRALAAEADARAKEEERRRIIADAQRLFDLDPNLGADSEPLLDLREEPLRPEGWAFRVAERAGRALANS
jgi:hypothetical protein